MKRQTIIATILLAAITLINLTLPSCAGEPLEPFPIAADMSNLICHDNVLYAIDETKNTVTVAGFVRGSIESDSQLAIPECIKSQGEYYIVSGIADYGCCEMPVKTFILPQTISKIGRYAFYGCSNLRFIKLQGSECPNASNVAFEEKTLNEAFLHIPASMEGLTSTFASFRNKVIYEGKLHVNN